MTSGYRSRRYNSDRPTLIGRVGPKSTRKTPFSAALAPDAKLANGRTQGSERLVDISVAGGPTVTLAIDAATKRPTRVVHVTESIQPFLQELLRRPHTTAPDALAKKPRPRKVNFVDVDDTFVLEDSMNAINLYHVLDSAHADINLLVYFPAVRVLTDADLYFPDDRRAVNDSDPQGHATFIHSLVVNINHRKLQVDRMMPIHGKLVPCDKFLEADMLLSSMLSAQD